MQLTYKVSAWMASYVCYLLIFWWFDGLLLSLRLFVNLAKGAILDEIVDIWVSQVVDHNPAPSTPLHCIFLPQVNLNHHWLVDLLLLRLNSRKPGQWDLLWVYQLRLVLGLLVDVKTCMLVDLYTSRKTNERRHQWRFTFVKYFIEQTLVLLIH